MQTLAEHLESDTVDFDQLHDTYGPMLGFVDELIGVIPDCDPYLEIWPPGFRTYNLLVPNMLNLPASLVSRSGVKALMGLAMYTSSRAAGCAYCSAHCCSFALRRGASREAVDGSSRTDVERAVVALAEGMATVPNTFDSSLVDDLGAHLPADDVEWVAVSIGLMGFLNKFMDALAIPLELEAINDVAELIEPTGWSVGQHAWRNGSTASAVIAKVPVDSVATYGRIARCAPGAVRLERKWTKHLPSSAPDLRRYLRDTHGVDIALLSRMRHHKAMRGVAAAIDQNLVASQSVVGLGNKALAGLVFAGLVDDDVLRAQARTLAAAVGVSPETVDVVAGEGPLSDLDARTSAVVKLARAISPSPAVVTAELAAELAEELTSPEIVEIAVWVSVQQLLHRLGLFYGN